MLNCQAPSNIEFSSHCTRASQVPNLLNVMEPNALASIRWIGWMVAFFHVVISGMQPENDKYDIGVFGFKSHKLQPTNAITICWFFEVVFDCEFLLHR